MSKPTPENDVKAEVRDWLKAMHWFVFPIMQGLGSYRGISDFIAVKDGMVLFIECKSERGRLSDAQKKFAEDVEWNGGHYVVAKKYEDVKRYIEQAHT